MLHVAAILTFAAVLAGVGTLLVATLLRERAAIGGALLMKPRPAIVAPAAVRVTRVRYAARLRRHAGQAPVLRAAA